jgi:hypothetical protein
VLTTLPNRARPSPRMAVIDEGREYVARRRRRRRSLWGLLRSAAGLDEELLALFPGDRSFYTRSIVCVAIVALMAVTSLTTALAMTTGSGPWGWPLVFGAGLGVLIAAVDLSIALPDGQPHHRRSWSYVGRVAFAVVAGVLLSMPLTAALFAPEVNRHEAQAQATDAATASARYDDQVAAARAGAHTQHAGAVEAATTARDTARDAAASAAADASAQRSACNAEIDGASGNGVGEGPRAGAKCSSAAQLGDQAASAKDRLDDTEKALQDSIRADVAAQDAEAAKVAQPTVAHSELGVVDRIVRTHEALGTGGTLAVAGFLVFLDLLPLTLKVSGGRRRYERVLEHRHDRALRELCQSLGAGVDFAEDTAVETGGRPVQEQEAPTLVKWLGVELAAEPRLTAADLARRAPAAGFEAGYSTVTRLIREHGLRPQTPGGRR